jgi:hypothetical protein
MDRDLAQDDFLGVVSVQQLVWQLRWYVMAQVLGAGVAVRRGVPLLRSMHRRRQIDGVCTPDQADQAENIMAATCRFIDAISSPAEPAVRPCATGLLTCPPPPPGLQVSLSWEEVQAAMRKGSEGSW